MKIFYFCIVLVAVAQQISEQDANSNYLTMSLFIKNFYIIILKLFSRFFEEIKTLSRDFRRNETRKYGARVFRRGVNQL